MAAEFLSVGQATFFICFGWTLCLWALAEWLQYQRNKRSYITVSEPPPDDEEGAAKSHLLPLKTGEASDAAAADSAANAPPAGSLTPGKGAVSAAPAPGLGHGVGLIQSCMSSALVRCMLMDTEAILKHRLVLRSMAEFGGLMFWYFLCDRTSVLSDGTKSYSRDVFLFIFVVLTSVAAGASMQTFKTPVLLNRPQTEEWKGWMQVLFLLYHYYEAKEVYNAIRIFISAYVWMTGFGNFSYYYKTADFSIGRFAQMLWRLNFLVFFACLVLRNSYMLYYICPMHTIFTIMVYAALAIAPKLNTSNTWIWIKLGLCLGSVILLWDVKAVFYAIWSPLRWLVGYVDPRKGDDQDALYEWYFRSGLDRYIWIYGMLCAFVHPQAASLLRWMEELPTLPRQAARTLVLGACAGGFYLWYEHVYILPKVQYNKVHPYTSWIPITLWIVVRNITPTLRIHHLRLYGWLGCITLETYISQFHIWMKTLLPDGQPKALLVLIPGYPLLNFAACSALYVFVSHRLFELTNSLKNAAVPHSNNPLLARNILLMGAIGAGLYCATWGLMQGVVYRTL